MNALDRFRAAGGPNTPRRALLGALAGAVGLAGTASAQDDGAVQTRGCRDEELTLEDWSTGAVTVRACPGSGGRVTVDVSGQVSDQRYVSSTIGLPSSADVYVPGGESRTLWYTGTLRHFSCSNAALNVGIVNRQ
ncbi:hypothetical protein [Natrialba swarupiae]|uniref:Uncharacterized protein n=1 Tax=Natrialba swarupiae TaxID=2448032 RepID=A0A5D5AUF2_9EURY|nr:hypothetical protein [Natrialba swarupiae]TYT63220.1 hypothetical protein FYC77_03870 [Natrialba swarupiae]